VLAAPWQAVARAREAGWISSFLLVAAVAVPIIAYSLMSNRFSATRIERIELSERTKDLASVSHGLQKGLQDLLTEPVEDYAVWTECRDAVSKRDIGWLDENMMDCIPEQFGIDVLYVISPGGETISRRGDYSALDDDPLAVRAVAEALGGKSICGLLDSPGGTYIAAASPIVRTDRSGSPVGVLIALRRLDSEQLAVWAKAVGTDVLFFHKGKLAARAGRASGSAGLSDPAGTFRTLSGGRRDHFEITPDKRVALMCRAVRDISGAPVGMIAIAAPRTDLLASQGALATSSLLLIFLCLAVAAALARGAYQRAVHKIPIRRLARAVRDMAHSGKLLHLSHPDRDDIGALFSAVNDLTQGWVRTKRELLMRTQTDELTGLSNHRHLQDRLQQEVDRARRYKRDLSLLFLDIDYFKVVNDTYGHQIGDEVLKRVAGCLMQNVRTGDIAARYGGEEFVVVLPETACPEALRVAEKIRRKVEETPIVACVPAPLEGKPAHEARLKVTISIGVADFPASGDDRDSLLMAADLALRQAKNESRNAVRAFSNVAFEKSLGSRDPVVLHEFVRDGILSAVRALACAMDARDAHTNGHSERVAGFAVALAGAAGLNEKDISSLRVAALLHDVGKLGIADRVLLKSGPLDPEEMEIMRSHAAIGFEILRKIPKLAELAPVIRHHHERYDGAGYPDGLVGDSIPLLSRILAVADAYEAMRSDRSYRPMLDKESAVAELIQGAGRQFDPELARLLAELVGRGLPGEETPEPHKEAA
jgi:diguanylate cyclase (GGDEF)-like protein/putative nucleotidyltransferase with HDIG domain